MTNLSLEMDFYKFGFIKAIEEKLSSDLTGEEKAKLSLIPSFAGSMIPSTAANLAIRYPMTAPTKEPIKSVIRKLMEQMPVPEDLTVEIMEKIPLFKPGPRYIPAFRHAIVPKNIAVAAHELGHASGRLAANPFWLKTHMGSRMATSFALPFATFALATGTIDPESATGKAVMYGTPVLAAPMIAEEARATAQGLKALRKLYGWKTALKATIPTSLGLLSYLGLSSVPLITGLLAKKYKND